MIKDKVVDVAEPKINSVDYNIFAIDLAGELLRPKDIKELRGLTSPSLS